MKGHVGKDTHRLTATVGLPEQASFTGNVFCFRLDLIVSKYPSFNKKIDFYSTLPFTEF